jgi:hypothetical protein
MNKQTQSALKGAAMGMMAGSALGAMGAYMACQHPKEVKRAMKTAGKNADKAMQMLERMMDM